MSTHPGPASSTRGGAFRVLVVDDEDDVRRGLALLSKDVGGDVRDASSAEAALSVVRAWDPHVVVSDITMPGLSGLDLLDELHRTRPHVRVVLITGFGTIEMAVSALQRGASHFLTKPFENEEVRETVSRLGREALLDEQLRAARAEDLRRGQFVARDRVMDPVLHKIAQVAPTSMSVLITGESGTGKELAARAIHRQSSVADRPFVALNTAALPDALLESELFGHARGAFTGATKDRQGLFQQAAGGTVFLDEVGFMSPAFQVKLLRVLQDRTVVPLGTSKAVPVDFRLVAATAQDLREQMAAGLFREDLFYRLNVVPIEMPPLRERPADIVPLAAHFLARYADCVPGLAGRALTLSREALQLLTSYSWPGNVRELENAVQRALVLSGGEPIQPEHLGLPPEGAYTPDESTSSYEEAKEAAVRSFQRGFIERALARSGGNVTRAAESCGMTRAALQRILRALDIDRGAFASD
ncbi:MAG: sigma-54-dependent transcriptional regulator [Planctomycetota bacterium]